MLKLNFKLPTINPILLGLGLLLIHACSGGGGGGNDTTPTEEEGTITGGVQSGGNLPNGGGGKQTSVKPLGTLTKTSGSTGTATSTSAKTGTDTATTTQVSDPLKSKIIYTGPETLKAGSPITLSFKGLTDKGEDINQGGEEISFTVVSGSGGGEFGPVEDHGDGTYSAHFMPQKAGNGVVLGAKIGKALVQETTIALSISPGDIDLARSLTTVERVDLPGGTSTNVSFVAKDAWGNSIGVGKASPVFTLADGTSTGTFASVQDLNNGSYKTTLLGLKAGTPTAIVVQVGVASSPLPSSPRIRVIPGTLSVAHSTLSVAGNVTELASGSIISLTLTAKDAGGNPLTKGGANVSWSLSSGAGISTGQLANLNDNNDGTYTASLSGQNVGTPMTINAQVNGVALTTTSPTLRVIPGTLSLANSTVQTIGGTTVLAAGSQATVQVTLKDLAGNIITTPGQAYAVSLALTSGTSTGAFQPATMTSPGIYQGILTGELAGSSSQVTATVDGLALTSPSPSIQVEPGPLSLSQSTLQLAAGSVASGSSTNITLTLKDSYGNTVADSSQSVSFETFGPGTSTVTIDSPVYMGSGSYQTSLTGVLAGSATSLRARIGGLPTTSSAPTIAVNPGPVSLSQSSLVVQGSPATIDSGSSANLTLTLKDAAGNQLTTGGATASFSLASGNSTGVFGTVTDGSDGTYTTVFTGQGAGTATSLVASVGGQPLTSPAPSLTVLPGPPSLATSVVTLAGSQTSVASGSSITATLQVRDAFGNPLTSGGLAVSFGSSGGTSTVQWGSVSDLNDGTYSVSITGVLKGTPLAVIGRIAGSPVTTTAPQLAVTQGPLSLGTSTTGISISTIISGQTTTLTLTTRDAAGNPFSTGGFTVGFSLAGGSSGGSFAPVIDHGNGTYSSVMTGTAAGSLTTVQTSINGSLATTPGPTITVVPAGPDAAQSTSSLSPSTIASGSQATLTVILRDASGNQLPSGGETVTAALGTNGTSTATVGLATDNGDGTYSLALTGSTAGTPTAIVVSVNGTLFTSTAPTLQVTSGPISLSQSTVAINGGVSTVTAGSSVTLTLTGRDAMGNLLTTGGHGITFATTGAGTSTGTFGTINDLGNGTYTVTFTGQVAGTAVSLQASIGGQPLTSPAPTISVLPGAYSLAQSTVTITGGLTTVPSGSSVTAVLTAKDALGNPLTTAGLAVTFGSSGGTSTVQWGSATDQGNGTYSIPITGVLRGTALAIIGRISGSPVTATAPQLTVTQGPLSLATSTTSVTSATVTSGQTTTATLTTRDAAGNPFSTGGFTVSFSLAGGTSGGSFAPVIDHGNGTYSSVMTGTGAGSLTTVQTSINGSLATTPGPTITVVPAGPDLAQSTSSLSLSSIEAGSTSTLTVVLRDSNGNQLLGGGATVAATLSNDGTSTAQVDLAVDQGNGTYAIDFTGNVSGTPASVVVTVDGSPLTSTAPTLQVTPGPFSLAASLVTIANGVVSSGTTTTISLTLRDTFLNAVPDGGQTVDFEGFGGGTSTFSLGPVSHTGGGVYQATLTGILSGSAKTLRALIGGQPTTSTAPTVTVTPGAISLAQSTLAVNGGATLVTSGSSVTLTLTGRDGAGNLLTSGGHAVTFATTGAGTSTGTFGTVNDLGNGSYTVPFTGQVVGTAVSIQGSISGQPLTSGTPTLTVMPGAYSLAQSSVTITGGLTSVASGSAVEAVLTAKDAAGNQLTTGGLTVTFIKSAGTSTISVGTVTDQGNGTYKAQITGVLKGTATNIIGRIAGSNVTFAAPQLTVTQGPLSLSASTTTRSVGSVAAGQTAVLTFTARDAAGNQFSTGGMVVEFSLSGLSQGTLDDVTDVGNGTYTALFTGTDAGTASTISTQVDGDLVTSASPTITVVPGDIDLDLSTASLSAPVLTSGTTSLLSVTLRDAYGNQMSTGGSNVTCALDGNGTSTASFGSTQDFGDGTYGITLTGLVSGTPNTVIVSVNGQTLNSGAGSITVESGTISPAGSTLAMESATVVSGTDYWVRLTARDFGGNLVATGGATVVFSHTGGTSTATIGPVTDVGDGTYTATLTGVTAGTATALAATIDGANVTTTAPTFSVVAAASTVLELSGFPTTVEAGSAQTLTVTAKDNAGNIDTNFVGTIDITSTDVQAVLSPASYTYTPADMGVKNFAVTLKTAGTVSVTATDAGNPLITVTQAGITVEAAPATHIAFNGVSESKVLVCSPNLMVESQDSFGNLSPVLSNLTVALTGQGSGTYYDDVACTNPVTTMPLNVGEGSLTLYFKSATPENLSLLASASGLISVSKNFAVKPYQAWLGSFSTQSLYEPGGHALRGRFDGMMNGPMATITDSDGKIYIADSSNHRIHKYDPNTGFEGWIGRVSLTPTGGFTGCDTAVGLTPGWCVGGFSSSGSGDGQMNSPGGIALSNTYLYVADSSNHRILRYELDTGTFAGWTGRILTSPTGGDLGCAGAAVGTTTPGWCTGGTAQSGSGMGQYNIPRNLLLDGDYLYIADNTNHRIAKLDVILGVMESWIGWINTSPTGGAAGCTGAAVSTVTPGWCSGGSAKTGTVMGSLKNPRGLATDGTYLYVADTGNHRIQRYMLATGTIQSWIGRVSSKPTGGDPGCSAAATNSFTPGWCIGGTSKSGTGNGAMSSPYSVSVISGDLFVADFTNSRINKYVASTAAFVGWLGRVLTVPTGGAAGCTTTTIGSATPGWCLGGTAQSGIEDGMMYSPSNVIEDNGSLLVTDNLNHRVAKIDPATGSYVGWLGARSNTQSDWTVSWSQPSLSGRDSSSFYSALGIASDGTNIYVADGTNHRIKNYSLSATGLDFTGWLGAIWSKPTGGGASCTGAALNATTPTWCSGGSAKTGTSNGQFNIPNDIYVDETHLYTVDKSNHRVQKFTKSTAAFVGWIGRINASPTGGDPGCSGAATNGFTPGWCSGGTAKSGNGDGHFSSPQGIYGDATYLYVVDTVNNRVMRFTKTTGAFGGWIGRVLTVPTGGEAGCTSVAIGSPTPGWCTGGTAQTGTGNGALSAPTDATGDGTYLYVSDSSNNRILRFDTATGSFQGWLGRISTSPTGGDAGCAGAVTGTATPGFCTGGTAQFGTGNGHLRTPRGLWTNGTHLYVVDGTNHRIVKMTTSGTFVGWQGRINTAPTGGESGCLGASSGTLTQGWCTGGTASRGDRVGMFDTPMFITGTDSTYLVVTQTNNSLLTRVPY